jgi:serine protease Do
MLTKRKTWILIAVALSIGIILGLVVASNLNWTKSGYARVEPAKAPVKPGSEEPALNDHLDLLSTGKAFVQVARQVMPTVVSISSAKMVRVRNPFSEFFHEDWWGRSFRDRGGRQREYRQEGLGSGVIISADGYILTNNHVIREAEEISVLIDKKEYKANIIGSDPKTDLSVIKVDAKNLPVAKLGNSEALEVGEWVLAIGNPFSRELHHSVTAGIVSGKGRTNVEVGDIEYEDFIQTDAAINPGNSGGALVNLRGELVGINTAIVSNGWGGGNLGIGFAIPINLAKQIMEQLIETGRVVRGWMGVNIQPVDENLAEKMQLPSTAGALVTDVLSDTPAERAGIRQGDFIIAFNGEPIRDNNHLIHVVAGYKPGTRAEVKLIRDGREKVLTMTLGERPDQIAQTPSTTTGEGGEFGIEVSDLTNDLAREYELEAKSGVVVTEVAEGSVAAREGIRPGDLIREVNREPVRNVAEFKRMIGRPKAGDIFLLRINRGKNNFFVALKVEND